MQAFWFGVIAVLWSGFFLLEGFDFGVGMLLPVVGRTPAERSQALRSIGPVWDGNEVWLLVAGGATFAAFPEWYASVFSGFYLAFALLLVGLILRGIGIEYRGKSESAAGRAWCEAAVVTGSFLPALLLGVAFANFARGVRMNPGHTMTDGFFSLLTPYALLGGVLTLTLFAFHAAMFLALRTDGVVRERARAAGLRIAPVTGIAAVAFLVWTATIRGGWVSLVLAAVIAAAFLLAVWFLRADADGRGFIASAVATALVPIWLFAALWPNVLPDRLDAARSLTVHNASSSPHTLAVMTGVALVCTPIVLVYQAWTYWVFRARVTGQTSAGYGPPAVQRAVESGRRSARQVFGSADGSA